MATNFLHRLFILSPASRQAVVNAWFPANLAPSGGNWLTAGLNATGLRADPVTHHWCTAGLTDAQAKALLVKIRQLALVPLPTTAQWDSATQATKMAWLVGIRAAVVAGFGVFLNLSDNAGAWDDFKGLATAQGLVPVDGLH